MEIVPWKLIPHVIALEYLPLVLSVKRRPAPKVPSPTLIIDEEGIVHTNDCGPEQFEFQASQIRPIPIESVGYNAGQIGHKCKTMALPSLVFNSDPRTPLNQRDVRRSTRLSATKKGF
jgi:hypothetical protein